MLDPTVQVAIVAGIFALLGTLGTRYFDSLKERRAKKERKLEHDTNVTAATTMFSRNERYMKWLELELDRVTSELRECRGDPQ